MRSEHARHNHMHGMIKQTLRLAFFLSLIIVVAEVTGGLLAHSLALLSDAGHALTDIFALGLAWFATAQAERSGNARKTFGYHRVGILAALINAITLILFECYEHQGTCSEIDRLYCQMEEETHEQQALLHPSITPGEKG